MEARRIYRLALRIRNARFVNVIIQKIVDFFPDALRTELNTIVVSTLLCGRPNRPHYGSCTLARPSVCLSVRFLRAPNSKTNRRRKKTKSVWIVNVPQSRSNRCANFQLKKSRRILDRRFTDLPIGGVVGLFARRRWCRSNVVEENGEKQQSQDGWRHEHVNRWRHRLWAEATNVYTSHNTPVIIVTFIRNNVQRIKNEKIKLEGHSESANANATSFFSVVFAGWQHYSAEVCLIWQW